VGCTESHRTHDFPFGTLISALFPTSVHGLSSRRFVFLHSPPLRLWFQQSGHPSITRTANTCPECSHFPTCRDDHSRYSLSARPRVASSVVIPFPPCPVYTINTTIPILEHARVSTTGVIVTCTCVLSSSPNQPAFVSSRYPPLPPVACSTDLR